MALTKIVDGGSVDMTAEEEAAVLAEWAANDPAKMPAPPKPRDAFAEIDALKVSLKSAKSFADINAAAVALDVQADVTP